VGLLEEHVLVLLGVLKEERVVEVM